MKTEDIKILKIELEGDEARHFKEAIKKIDDENKRAGFKHLMNVDEKQVIEDINKKIN